ncbi:hypothetical protein O181_040339 [Austropuccinia psidii MF-1]|uniref:Uncharacterized protein n=1 Tax=Austropuccinia psidii MF-1 TaxID=1389203 RepID=A0A9Q3DC83_9BASI|nr:hypothetical protein [Austropuccinia psidii MF-1]
MKPQSQSHVFVNNPHLKEEIKPDSLIESKHRSPSQYQDGDSMTYSEKEALKQLTKATRWAKLSGVVDYDHMELIDYIDRLFIDVSTIPDYWITARIQTEYKGKNSICYK